MFTCTPPTQIHTNIDLEHSDRELARCLFMLSHMACLQVFRDTHVLVRAHMPIIHMRKKNHIGPLPLSTTFHLFLASILLPSSHPFYPTVTPVKMKGAS